MLIDCVNVRYHNLKEKALNELDIEVLTYLENLGYSSESRGTHYFKDMVVALIEKMLSFSSLNGEEMDTLMMDIINPYSQFYLDIARNKNDLGINTFNQYIRQAINLNEDEITGFKAYQFALDILQNKGLGFESEIYVRKLDK